MRLAFYTTPGYLDTTIPLANELSKRHEIYLAIEHLKRTKTSICETGRRPEISLADSLSCMVDFYS